MSKILKNTTISDIELDEIGITVPASGQYILNTEEYNRAANTDSITEITTHINSGDLVVNDGVDDITVANGFTLQEAIDYLKMPTTAFNMRFAAEPERSNGFTVKNTQEAIEQAKFTGVGTVIPYKFTNGGSNANNVWLSTSDPSATSDEVPYIVPQHSVVKGVSFTNKDDDSETDIEVYINGIYSFCVEVRNKRYYWKVGATLATLNQGDRISVFLRNVGQTANAPSKPLIMLLAKVDNETVDTDGEQYGDTF